MPKKKDAGEGLNRKETTKGNFKTCLDKLSKETKKLRTSLEAIEQAQKEFGEVFATLFGEQLTPEEGEKAEPGFFSAGGSEARRKKWDRGD